MIIMKNIVKCCKACENNPNEYRKYFDKIFTDAGFQPGFVDLGVVGYYTVDENKNEDFCQVHPNEKLEISSLSSEEFGILSSITNDLSFIHAMEDLKQSDPIEFQLKMSQFKANLSQTKTVKENSNIPHCPTCGSEKLSKVSTMSKAGSVFMFGLLSQKVKKTWHCDNCGYEW